MTRYRSIHRLKTSNKSKPDTGTFDTGTFTGTLVVGLTGGIGTGKSLALAELARLGAKTVSLDGLAHGLSRKGGPLHRSIVRAFGRGILGAGGEIDRGRLGDLAFRDPSARRRLERATHPGLLAEMRRRIRRARGGVVVVDVPLLFEKGLERRFDVTLAVACSPARQAARVRKRDGLSGAEVRRRMAAQLPSAEKERRADVVVPNDGSRHDFRRRLKAYYEALSLIQRSAHGGR